MLQQLGSVRNSLAGNEVQFAVRMALDLVWHGVASSRRFPGPSCGECNDLLGPFRKKIGAHP